MTFNPDIHHRRSIRLREYDYSSAGAYFVTVCVEGRECLFGEAGDGSVNLNEAGRMVAEWWTKLPDRFPGVQLDEFVTMPNHVHGIVVLVGATPCGCPSLSVRDSTPRSGRPRGAAPTLGDVMDWFKTMTTNAYIRGVKQSNWPPFPGRLWQRNYYERVIRDDDELTDIRGYIRHNPAQWEHDGENPTIASP
jgi:REP element-mobilizing transposase RayT